MQFTCQLACNLPQIACNLHAICMPIGIQFANLHAICMQFARNLHAICIWQTSIFINVCDNFLSAIRMQIACKLHANYNIAIGKLHANCMQFATGKRYKFYWKMNSFLYLQLQFTCQLHANCMQIAHQLHANCMQIACKLHANCMQFANLHANCMQIACQLHAICMQFANCQMTIDIVFF